MTDPSSRIFVDSYCLGFWNRALGTVVAGFINVFALMLVKCLAQKLAETVSFEGWHCPWCLREGQMQKFFIHLCKALHNCEEYSCTYDIRMPPGN